MSQDDRALLGRTLERARQAAYPAGEYVGQESFMRASEILSLADRAGIGPGVSVLDVCCGVAGPGRLITRELGCSYTGVDISAGAVEIARERSHDLDCRFQVSHVPPLPVGPFEVVLLLETMLAFPEKAVLVRAVASALRVGGRFAFTLEEGDPLTEGERVAMPHSDTVWPVRLPEIVSCLERAGLRVRWQAECSRTHHETVDALIAAFTVDASGIAAGIGHAALDDLLAAHRLWSDWLGSGRVRKFAVVAEVVDGDPIGRTPA